MLRLLSWNVFNENRDAGRIVACLDAVEPDVFVVQEALPAHLAVIRSRFPHLATARDYILKGETCFLAIASKLPLAGTRVVSHFPDDKPHPSPFSRWAGWVEFLDTLSAEVVLPDGGSLRCAVFHTSAATSPTVRAEEVELGIAAHVDEPDGPCLVAGDFNCFSSPWIAPLLAVPFGYRWRDLGIGERRSLEARWQALGFRPAVSGVTIPRWRLQTDQVFMRGIRVRQARIVPTLWGSDHRPIVVEIEAETALSRPASSASASG